jgi:hypothetical protein
MEEWNGQTVGEVGDEGRGNGRGGYPCVRGEELVNVEKR